MTSLQNVSYPISFHVYDLTVISGGGGDGGGVTGESLPTNVRDCVSTSISVTPLDILKETGTILQSSLW